MSATDWVQCLRFPGLHPSDHRHCDEHQQQHQGNHQSQLDTIMKVDILCQISKNTTEKTCTQPLSVWLTCI